MFKRLQYVLCMFFFLLISVSARTTVAQEITVMTRNLYVGADILSVTSATTPEELMAAVQAISEQIAASNFPERAEVIAAKIVEKNPHLVGLQEVYSFTFNGNNGPVPYRDYLTDLMTALAARGVDYRVAAVVRNTDLQIPVGGNILGVTDRDVILARGDVATSVVPVAQSGCRPSMDGCNYTVFASAVTPFGVIASERGFVAVDAFVDGPIRFVNTHLEQREPDPTNPLSPFVQAAQAFQLISILSNFPKPPDAPVIVVGDINSDPEHPILTDGGFTIVPPYKQLVMAGYTDMWTLRPGNPPGLTCCQDENLLNLDSILYERIDVAFSSILPPGQVKVNVVGNDEADKTPFGLWPSDHAGVVAQLEFWPQKLLSHSQ